MPTSYPNTVIFLLTAAAFPLKMRTSVVVLLAMSTLPAIFGDDANDVNQQVGRRTRK